MRLLYIILAGLIFFSCKTFQKKEPEKCLYFGSGGGFTGMVKTYKISNKGWIEELDGTGKSVPGSKHKINKKQVTACFKLSSEVKNEIPGFREPGNIYYFISYTGPGEASPDYTWGKESFPVPQKLNELYKKLQLLIKTVK